jgi:hypothetical protein
MPVTTPIVLFLLFGACFGFATYSRRHLFSEGPTRRAKPQDENALGGRLMWMLICTFLWPIMALTGVHSAWLLAARRRAAARLPRD